MYVYPPAPHDNEYLYDLSIEVDKRWCLNIYQTVDNEKETYNDSKHGTVENWKVIRLPHFDYADEIMEELGLIGFVEDYRPRFYVLKSNTILEKHIDLGTQCAINFVLSDHAAPVTFEDTENFYYTTALFNTSLPHSVTNGDEDRILFKVSIMDKSFEQVRERIQSKQVGNHSLLSTQPEYQPYRDKYQNIPRIHRKQYNDIHTSNLTPTDIIIDCDLFEKEIVKYKDDFQQWGVTHTDLERYGLAITKDSNSYTTPIYPTNWPLDVWNLNNPDLPIIETDFKYPNDVLLSMQSLQPIMQLNPHLARSNILKWGSNARFYPHIDVMIPAGNLRLWGTNDPDNNHFCFWDEQQQQYVEELGVERGRLYLADTSKWHHAYSTGEDVYTFFIALQVSAYDQVRKLLRPQ